MATKLTPLALAALELLLDRPMHPYEMHRTMRLRHTDRVVKLKAGSLYHAVERLERLGLVEAEETERSGRRPERTRYRITDAGRRRFAEEVPDLISTVADEYPAFPLGLAFSDDLNQEAVLAALRRRRTELESRIKQEQAQVARVTKIELPDVYWLDLRYTLMVRQAELAFVDQLTAEIESGELDWDATVPEETRT
ncbi:helix-turn-helix transcriptional regulator [Phytoactinopolyspora limicola]|uniref:helix-turn-helix transcriptional regulator n=1 Tax=Phytoactinopolyspora limicola TaxID=2715536 RepID=UPI001408BF58|nr:helix-turn-helix transcriptional regulator [Phytoactinopolyspora limicola]